MELKFDISNENLLVGLNGELDHHTAEEVRKRIDDIFLSKSLKNITFDLKGLKFMDSSGIGLIIGRFKLVRDKNGEIGIINAGERMKKMMVMSGIQKIAKFHDEEQCACHADKE